MIQFNLLPDVKLAYVKAQRTKRMVIGGALIATAASGALFALLFTTVHVVQRFAVEKLDNDIKTYTKELKDTPDLDKILTIQNQLGALGGLHDAKPLSSRNFVLMQQLTPADVTISDFTTDHEQGTVEISGQAPSLDRVNIFTDTLKFAGFTTAEIQNKKAFSEVVLSQFNRSDNQARYTITAKFDEAVFSGANDISLTVPKTVTTRSVTQQPTDIFKRAPEDTNQQGTR